MSLLNVQTDTVLADKVGFADTFLKRLRGLMFSSTFPREYGALVISPCNVVHTMFMNYPIDVVFVDKKWNVLHCFVMMTPGKLSPMVKGAYAAVELPVGTLVRSQTKTGDALTLVKRKGAVSS
ncbi:MAG: DUF192 domain-containing protein [Dethiobacter sp.]|jgi:uncharacterized membrane protein (UPF0127 family)|nr:DUF192 domain-containing protein [Dethiobacter sp.]